MYAPSTITRLSERHHSDLSIPNRFLKPQPLLKRPPLPPHWLNQRKTLRRRSQPLHAIDQIQRTYLSIITKEQLGPLPPIKCLGTPIRKAHRRIERLLQLESPRPCEVARVHVRADSRILAPELGDVDHPVREGVPVAAFVGPEEWVFCPVGVVVGAVPWCCGYEFVWAVVGWGRVDL